MSGNRDVQKRSDTEEQVSHDVLRLQAGVVALVFGLLGGVGVFVMTVWLLIKGGPNVGDHLRLLGQYFIGYTVTYKGAVVGFFYGTLVGGAIGWTIGFIYNRIARIRFPVSDK